MISVVHVTNPVQPSVDRHLHELVFVPGQHLDAYLLGVFPSLAGFTVSLNGRVLAPEQLAEVIPLDGDSVVVVPALQGGSLLRSLAAIAVLATAAVVTGGLAAGPLAALGATTLGSAFAAAGLGGLSVTTASIIGAAIVVGGNLLVGALLGNSPSSKGNTASYDPDGPKSLARSGTVIPKGYGTFQWGGNIISSFTDLEGADQYINCLVCYGWGPARSITNLQINGKDVSTYQNVQYYLRMGANNQQPIPNFNRVVNGYPQDVQCLAGVPVVVPGTGTLTQILQVDILFPDGVFVETKKGNTIPAVITYQVLYRLSGTTGPWTTALQPLDTSDVITFNPDGSPRIPHPWCVVATDMPPNSGIVYALDDGPHTLGDTWTGTKSVETFQANGNHAVADRSFKGEWQMTNPLINQILVNTWSDGYVEFIGCDRQPLYNRTNIYGLAAAKYDVQVIKYGSARQHDDVQFGDNNDPSIGQQVWIHSVNEVSLLDLAYPNLILIGIRALATNQLNGSSINVTARITHGLRTLDTGLLPTFLQAYEEDNPACVLADAALDGLYGGGQFPGYTAGNITRFADEWTAWAELNDQLVDDGNGGSIRRHVFNGVFDNEGSLQDAFNTIGRMSRSAVIPMGKDLGVFLDQIDTPVQIFSMGNIVQDSFSETWLEIDSRANQVEVQFADSTRYYRQDNPLVYMDPANQDAGVTIKNARIDGRGVTIPAQAWHLARFKERCNQFLLRTGSFKCDTDALACRPGNVAILQHDVPQWGQGGRTLPGSTASVLLLDLTPTVVVAPIGGPGMGGGGGTHPTYSVVVQHAALQRYSTTVTATTTLADGTVQVSLAAFDNTQRVTRLVLGTLDCAIITAIESMVTVQPCAGFAAAPGVAALLFDTDVLETCPVSSVVPGPGTGVSTVTLSTPLSRVPFDYSVYFYGQAGTQKLVRIQNIKKASEFRSTVEWIDYDADVYVDATPTVGSTSPLQHTNPGVTTLVGTEQVVLDPGGSYVGYASLTWRLGPDTAGVGVYGAIVGGNNAKPGGLPQLLARLPHLPTSWKMQIDAGNAWEFTVVGYDVNESYAAFKTAPSVTIEFDGVAANLLLGSNFASGFAFWNKKPRAGDTLLPVFTDDGQADYTVLGTTLTTPFDFLFQVVPPGKWAVGDFLMLSAYFQDECLAVSAPNHGFQVASLAFTNAAGTRINAAISQVQLNGVLPSLQRTHTAAVQIPTGTAFVTALVGVGNLPAAGIALSVPAGSILTASHLLLEVCSSPAQMTPSDWADIDVNGNVLDLFTSGSSTGLRVQGSTVPSFTGQFNITPSSTSVVIAWVALVIVWPDGAYTWIQDGSVTVTGLTLSTAYQAYPYFDIINGGVVFLQPSSGASPVGSPPILTTVYDTNSDAATRQDGRVPLAPGGLAVLTTSSGTGPGAPGGGGGGGVPPPPTGGPRRPINPGPDPS